MTPHLPDESELAGVWTSTGAGRLVLALDRQTPPPNSTAAPFLAARSEGLPDLFKAVAGWRPIPLGFEVTDPTGRTLAAFERLNRDAVQCAQTPGVVLHRRGLDKNIAT